MNNFCDTCRYDYRITVRHPDSDTNFYDSGWQLEVSSANIPNDTLRNFPETGVYQLTKRMRPSISAAEEYRQSIITQILNNPGSQTCFPLDTVDSFDCNISCSSLCTDAYVGTNKLGQIAYFDANMNWKDSTGTPYSDMSPAHVAAINTCLANCGAPQSFQNDLCSIRLQLMKNDLTPGGQYFDNLPSKYLLDINGNYFLDPQGDKVVDPNYLENGWLDANITIAQFNTALVPVGTFSNWADVRNNWDDSFLDALVTFHPEYCRYEVLCLNNLSCSSGDSLVNPISSVNDYVTLLFAGDSNSYAIDSASHGYNFFNPMGQAQNTNPSNPATYCPEGLSGKDPLSKVTCLSDFAALASDLSNYLTFIDSFGNPDTFSLWYVLDDPNNIATTTPPSSVPASIVHFFQSLHGTGTNPGSGLIGSGSGQISKYQFFRSAYLFYREMRLYNYANTNACSGQWANYANGDGNYDGIRESDGFRLVFPPDPVYDSFPLDTSNFGNTTQLAACTQNCDAFAADWMLELQGCIDSSQLDSNSQALMRQDLIFFCVEGCDVSNQFQGSSNGNGVSYLLRGTDTLFNFTDVIDYYLAGCNTVVVHPAPSANIEDCHCGPLADFIDPMVTGTNPFAPTSSELATITTTINNQTWNNPTYTQSQVAEWVNHCNDGSGNIDNNYPNQLECVDCKCASLTTYIEGNALAVNVDSTTQTERNAIATDLSTLSGTTITATDVQNWLSQCNASNPNETVFGNFPDTLDCSNEPAEVLDVTALALMLCRDELQRNDSINKALRFANNLHNFANEQHGRYLQHCRDAASETLNATYELDEYYYTLYFYDQAGNLIKTVAPRDVDVNTPSSTADLVNVNRKADNGVLIHPDHTIVTRYRYNGLNQVVEQSTPDGGETQFWYNRIGQLVASQSARQKENSSLDTYWYSYSSYDALGRVVEAGEMYSNIKFDSISIDSLNNVLNSVVWPANVTVNRQQVTRTFYDQSPGNIAGQFSGGQRYLRNRIASVTFEEVYDPDATVYDNASHYNYDIHGNVRNLLQENRALTALGHDFKQIDYTYDLISGNVQEVAVQQGERDQFFHRYNYDADNRITQAWTSSDGVLWDREVKYFYYPHGPLARTELGDRQVQATDHAYTLQGWLKSANANTLSTLRDPGQDGRNTVLNKNKHFGADAFGFSLHYFEGDYDHIGSNTSHLATIAGTTYGNAGEDLFNGNISRMVTALSDENENPLKVHGATYRYDQLNRIRSANFFKDNGTGDLVASTNSFNSASNNNAYQSTYHYDFNGNITDLTRYNATGAIKADEFTYEYDYSNNSPHPLNNRLNLVKDDGGNDPTWDDLEDQDPGNLYDTNDVTSWNYAYDASGNLIADKAEEIESILWTVTGKVQQVVRNSASVKPDMEFFYDPMGNRLGKVVKGKTGTGSLVGSDEWEYTWYLRDAQGNHLSTYATEGELANNVMLEDHLLYGSSRLGSQQINENLNSELEGLGRISFAGDEVSCSLAEVVVYVDGVAINNAIQWTGATTMDNLITAINSYTSVPNYTASTVITTGVNATYLWITPVACPSSAKVVTIPTPSTSCGNWTSTIHQNVGVCSAAQLAQGIVTLAGPEVVCAPSEVVLYVNGVALNAAIPWSGSTTANSLSVAINSHTSVPNYTATTITGDPFSLLLTPADCPSAAQLITSSSANSTCQNWTVTVHQNIGVCPADPSILTRTLGQKRFELSNHLGNVLEVISDRKLALDDNSDNLVDMYTADVSAYSDYFPFGALQPLRHGGENQRYGFQGQEMDDELRGKGNSVNYKYRMHDARIGRFFAVDPLAPKYPHNSPYAFSENSTIAFIELEGLEKFFAVDGSYLGQIGSSTELMVINDVDVWNSSMAVINQQGFSGTFDPIFPTQFQYLNAIDNIMKNSTKLYRENEREEILKKWGKGYLPKSYTLEWGTKVFSRTFTDENGNEFKGLLIGGPIEGFKDGSSIYLGYVPLYIRGKKIAYYVERGISMEFINPHNWNFEFVVHTHPYGNDDGFSFGDADYSIKYDLDSYMIEYKTDNVYFFDREKYKTISRKKWRYDDLAGELSFDLPAIKKATKKEFNLKKNEN